MAAPEIKMDAPAKRLPPILISHGLQIDFTRSFIKADLQCLEEVTPSQEIPTKSSFSEGHLALNFQDISGPFQFDIYLVKPNPNCFARRRIKGIGPALT